MNELEKNNYNYFAAIIIDICTFEETRKENDIIISKYRVHMHEDTHWRTPRFPSTVWLSWIYKIWNVARYTLLIPPKKRSLLTMSFFFLSTKLTERENDGRQWSRDHKVYQGNWLHRDIELHLKRHKRLSYFKTTKQLHQRFMQCTLDTV